nr:hypothetical protein [Tanacetum cinerariifolium]
MLGQSTELGYGFDAIVNNNGTFKSSIPALSEGLSQSRLNIMCQKSALLLPELRFTGLKDRRDHDMLYSYIVSFLNEIKPLSVKKFPRFLSGLS